MLDDLKERVALVTGGATGIGGAISAAFGAAGMKVALHYHAGAEAAQGIADRIRRAGGDALLLQSDVTQPKATEDLVRRTVEKFGRLDVLVNNAGGMVARRPVETLDDEFFDAVIDLNVRQLVHACRAGAAAMTPGGSIVTGSIINVSSISARTGGSPGSSIYSGAKAFVSTFTRSLARELAPRNIRVNALSPGTIATAFHERHSTPEKLEATRKSIPLARLGRAEDCAGTALFLASDALSGYVTGQVIEVNGGQFMG